MKIKDDCSNDLSESERLLVQILKTGDAFSMDADKGMSFAAQALKSNGSLKSFLRKDVSSKNL